jgi:signal transduction histidine kinase
MDEMEKKLLAISYKDAQRLDRIICKLLEMSRLEAGTSRFKKTLTDVVDIADEAIARFSTRAISRNIEIKKRYSAEKIEAVLDSDAITEVFTNLLSNALKFTEKGSIEIGVSDKGEFLECYVKDTGAGISKENQPKLFSKFKQFGKPVVEYEKGTGLGLFIVKEILRRHYGTLAVASEPGKGTTFSFTLPKNGKEHMAEAQ